MKIKFTRKILERYSRQIVLKDVGISGQKRIFNSRILIVGAGGLGCPAADYLCRSGIGNLGIADFDKVNISNLHRQSVYFFSDIGKFKVDILQKYLKKINTQININKHKIRISEKNVGSLIKNYDIIIDGSDNFYTKFLLNKASLKKKKVLISGAISKFDGHVFTFDFKNKKEPCLQCFYQTLPSDEILDCESEGILGPVAGIIGNIQANEALKIILNIGKSLKSNILITNLKNLNFRKVKFLKKKDCIC